LKIEPTQNGGHTWISSNRRMSVKESVASITLHSNYLSYLMRN